MYTDYRPRSTGPVSRYRLVQAWDWFKVFTHRHSSVHNTSHQSPVKVAQITLAHVCGPWSALYNTIVIILRDHTSPFILNTIPDTQRVVADGCRSE